MRQTAKVLQIDGATATVRWTIDSCASCSGESCGVRSQDVRVTVPAGVHPRIDDWVEIAYSSKSATIDALLVLGLPIGVFILFYGMAPVLFQSVGEALRIAFGFAGLAAGAIVPVLRKRLVPTSGFPAVTRVVRLQPPGAHAIEAPVHRASALM